MIHLSESKGGVGVGVLRRDPKGLASNGKLSGYAPPSSTVNRYARLPPSWTDVAMTVRLDQ